MTGAKQGTTKICGGCWHRFSEYFKVAGKTVYYCPIKRGAVGRTEEACEKFKDRRGGDLTL